MAPGATHYNWRWDVANLAARVESLYSTAGNTYFDHPSNWWQFSAWPLDPVSVDFWSPWGRDAGYPWNNIDPDVGYAIANYVWYDPNPPWIRWYIWQGVIWVCPVAGDASRCYGYYYDDPNDLHYDHVHFTFHW